MKVLIDTNVLLDVALLREPHLAESDAAVKWCQSHPGRGFVAWHTISNLYYIIHDDARAREFIGGMLETFAVPPTGTAAVKLGLRLPMADFEDALQVAAAIDAGVDVIVTRNPTHFRQSPIPARRPGEFLASLAP